MILDTSFWLKLIQQSDFLVEPKTRLRKTMALADRFSTTEECLASDEKDLTSLCTTDSASRCNLFKPTQMFDKKETHSISSRRHGHRKYPESWLADHQSTPVNPKTFCNLSLGLFSRISFNDHPTAIEYAMSQTADILPVGSFDHLVRTPDNQSKYIPSLHSCQKKTPLLSLHGMRTNKSLSDTISLQKKIPMGTERLKRLIMPKLIFKRPTMLFRKQLCNLKNRLLNSFSKNKTSDENSVIHEKPATLKTPRRMLNDLANKPKIEIVHRSNQERGILQILNINQNLNARYSMDNPVLKCPGEPVPNFATKRFKLGAPTTFLTRSLSNHSYYE